LRLLCSFLLLISVVRELLKRNIVKQTEVLASSQYWSIVSIGQ
jgi:hypothetical protein